MLSLNDMIESEDIDFGGLEDEKNTYTFICCC